MYSLIFVYTVLSLIWSEVIELVLDLSSGLILGALIGTDGVPMIVLTVSETKIRGLWEVFLVRM